MIESDALLRLADEIERAENSEDDSDYLDGNLIAAAIRAMVPDEPEFIIGIEFDDEYEPEHDRHIRAHIFCPHCGAEDRICEVDVSARWNRLGELQIDREPLGDLPVGYRWATAYETEMFNNNPGAMQGAVVVKRTVDAQGKPYTQDEADIAVIDRALVWTNASTGDGNYDHDGWICESCLGRSVAPDYFEIGDWS
jgi:hypothetical protein